MDVDTPFDWEVWRKAWGSNKTTIVGGVNDFIALPEPPGDCEWLLTRTLTGEHPTYRLALLWRELFDDGPHVCLRHGLIDKKMYGEAGVRQLAEVFKEWYARRNEPAPAGAGGDPP